MFESNSCYINIVFNFPFPVWSVKDKKLKQELSGHADEVFALDWALDGSRVASGGKDKVVKM